MMTYFGALILAISAFCVGIYKAKDEEKKVKALREICLALEILKNEICTSKTPIGKVLSLNSIKAFKTTAPFFAEMEREFSSLGEKRFADIWSESVRESLSFLPDKSKNLLMALGGSLGKYDSDLQNLSIERCISALQAEGEELDKKLKDNEKMYIGLYGGAGLIVALMLI